MSITLGQYTVETKKTVGELPAGVDDILGTPPCLDTVNLTTVQPVWKKIHEYEITDTAVNIGSQYLININYQFPDDVFADGFDYEIAVDLIQINGTAPITIRKNHISYTQGVNNWWFPVTNSLSIIMNEDGCGGSYANASRLYGLWADSSLVFDFMLRLTINQLIPATIEIELCNGGIQTNKTALVDENYTIEVYPDIPDGMGERVTVVTKKRKTNYDPTDSSFSELAKMPSTCLGYSVYYTGYLFSSPYTAPNEKTYWLDSGIYETKIDIPKVPPQSLDFKLWDGAAFVFDEPSDLNGLVDWIAFTPTSGVNVDLQLWNSVVQELSSGQQYVYFNYDRNSYTCPCTDCVSDCGEINVIFHQSCGESYGLKFNLSIQEGKYNIEGDTFTQGNEIIRPITKIKAVYDFVISEYSDETYLLLQELISDNDFIEVVDNIDLSNPSTLYYIDTELLSPNWNFNSKLGSLTIPVIKKDSIKTKRRNCCN